MADGVSITLDPSQVESFRARLAEIGSNNSGFKIAAIRAVKRTQTGAKTLIAKEIGKKATLKAKFIKSRIKSLRPNISSDRVESQIRISAEKIFSIRYKHGRQTRRGVSIKIFKDSPAIKNPHAFLATTPNGHEGIFRRNINASNYDGRLPLFEYRGPSIATLFEITQGLRQRVLTQTAARLLTEMERQTAYILSQQ